VDTLCSAWGVGEEDTTRAASPAKGLVVVVPPDRMVSGNGSSAPASVSAPTCVGVREEGGQRAKGPSPTTVDV